MTTFIYSIFYRRLNQPPPPLPEEVRLFATALTLNGASILEGLDQKQAKVMAANSYCNHIANVGKMVGLPGAAK